MATTQVVTSCEGDPNFGIILSFMEQFGPVLDVGDWNIAELKAMLENTESVPQALVDLHIKLMRKINKKVPPAKWELNLAKFAHSYSHQDAWEIERFGYKTANLAVKLRVLKALLEGQFDLNTKFKTQINTTVANELRLDPLGRDRQGNSYWYFMDNSANLQIYQMDAEMESWTLVASNRDEFVKMIEMLKENRPIEPLPVPEFVEEEEDSGADSTSESEAMKRGMIPAPTEAPPSLIISRRTYKTVTEQTDQSAATDAGSVKEQRKEDNTAKDVKMEEDADRKSEERPAANTALNDTKTVKQKEEQPTETSAPGHATKEESLELEKPVKTEMNAKECEAMSVDTEPEQTDSVDVATPAKETEVRDVAMEVDEKPEVPLPKAEKDASPGVAVLPSDAPAKVDSEENPQEGTEESSDKESLAADSRKEASDKPSADKATVGEAIEDPPVMVSGEGSGADCDSATAAVQPMFSEVIEEPIMFFYGLGAGVENDMGNTKKVESALATAHKDTGNNGEGTSLSGANGDEAADGGTDPPTDADAGSEVDGSRNSPLKKIAITKGNDTPEEDRQHVKVAAEEDANGNQRVAAASDDEINEETEAKEAHKGKSTREKGNGSKRTKKPNTLATAEEEEPSADARVSAASRGKQKTEVPSETGSVMVVEKKRGRKAATPRKASATVATVVVSQEAESSEDASIKADAGIVAHPLKTDEAVEADLKFNIKRDENGGDAKHTEFPTEPEKTLKLEKKEEDIKVKLEQSATTVAVMQDASKQQESSVDGDGDAGTKNEEASCKPATNDQQKKQTDLEKAAEEGEAGTAEGESPTKRKRRQRNGLVDGLDISMVLDAGADGGGTVRQSRRIAMQKIKEETNRRQIEDQMLKKMKADAVQKKKDLGMQVSDDDEYRKSASSDSSSSTDGGLGGEGGGRRRKKKKKKKKGSLLQQQQQEQLLQQQLNKKNAKWNSATSSESSSETEAEDYFADEHYHSEEDVRRTNALKSDHEFSPESDLESEAPAQPLKRARTARKAKRVTREEAEEEEEEEEDESNEDHACQECKKMDQPEWILLCDSCDKGYHCACLKPVLFTIPEGDWFCPVCQHRQLIVRLQSKLDLFDALQAKLAAEERRRREEEQVAREAELAEQALANEREARLRAEKRARQQQRLLERADAAADRRSATGSSDSESDGDDDDGEDARERKEESKRQKRKRRQRQSRSAAKKRRSVSASVSDRSENGSHSGSGSNTEDSDDIPIYKLRRRASAKVSYKFNEYDNLIDSAIRREMRNCEVINDQEEEDEDDDHRRPADEDEEEDEEGYGMSKGKDISTIIEATAREEAARKKALLGDNNKDAIDKAGADGDDDDEGRLVNGGSDDGETNAASRKGDRVVDEDEDSEGVTGVRPKATTGGKNRGSAGSQAQKKRKKKKKLCQIELSSEEEAGDDDSDEDFRGDVSGSEDDEDEEEDDDDDEMNSMSGDSESSLEVRGRGSRVRKPSGRAAATKRRRIVENSDDSDEDEDEDADRRRKPAKGGRKGRVLEDSDEDLDLDDEEDDSEDYDSDDLCSDTETELSRSSSSGSSSSNSSSGASSSDGDWRKKKKKKKDKKSKSKGKASKATGSSGGGGAGAGKHIERPKKASTGKGSGASRGKKGLVAGSSDRSASDHSSESGSDVGGKGGKTMPRIAKKQGKKTGPAGATGDSEGSVGAGEKKTDRKTRGKKIHYIVDEDFESSDDGIRPGVQRPDTPPEEREQFIRRQEEIKRMLAENNAAKAKELATSKIDQLVGSGGGAGAAAAGSRSALKDGSKDSLSVVPMQVIESARVLDIDFLKSTSGNTARIATVDSVVDFDDELPEDFDPDDEMDDEALAKIMEEEDFAHHQLKPSAVAVPVTPGAADVPPSAAVASSTGPKSRRKSIDPDEFALLQQQQQQQQQQQHRASAIARVPGAHGKEHAHSPHLPQAASQLPVNLSPSGPPPYSAIVQSPMKALLKTPPGPAPPPPITGGIPTSTIISPNVASTGGGASTILANALQTVPPIPPHHHHGPHPATLPPPPLLKEPHMSGRPDVLMRHGPGLGPSNLPHPSLSSLGVPPELHHKPELAHLISGLTGVPLRLPKGSGPPTHHAGGGVAGGHHRMPPVTGPGITMPPSMLGHAPHLKPSAGPPPPSAPPVTSSNSIAAHSQAPAASTVASNSNAERRAGRRKKITPLREDLKRKGAGGLPADTPIPAAHQEAPAAVPPSSQLPLPPPPHHHSQQPPFLAHPQHHPHHHLGGSHGVPRLPSHGATGPPVRPPPTITSSHNTAQQNASAIAAAAAAAAAVQELAIKVQQTRPDGAPGGNNSSNNSGGSNSGSNMHINEPPISVPSSVSHLSYLSENPLFAHRLGPLPSSILASSSSSLQRIAAMSGAGPPFGDPAAYNGGWKQPPGKPKTTVGSGPGAPPPGMMVGPPVGPLEHYHDYNPATHYNPYYNVLDRAHHLRPPSISELHRTSTLSPTTFTTLQPVDAYQHGLKPGNEPPPPHHHHHHPHHHHPHHAAATAAAVAAAAAAAAAASSATAAPSPATSSSAITAVDDSSNSGGGDRLTTRPPSSSSITAAPPPETVVAAVAAAAVPTAASSSSVSSVSPTTVAESMATPPSAAPVAAPSTSASTSVFGELVSYFSSQQDDLDS
ncbi:hypothetical protein AND_002683 [Anopheles darlingi]|uniref:PHD-type domain-containing protein n=1 Tax=Anopheles darlingi TaxID=43151 RepID=W5JMD9_ANODA|nr:hypothetical protein AND_002683 [Anopheles darlingi]